MEARESVRRSRRKLADGGIDEGGGADGEEGFDGRVFGLKRMS